MFIILVKSIRVAELGDDQEVLDQVRARNYQHRYAGQPVTLIGMDFSRERRSLAGFAWEGGVMSQ